MISPDDFRRRLVDSRGELPAQRLCVFLKIEMELLFSRPPSETVGGENSRVFWNVDRKANDV